MAKVMSKAESQLIQDIAEVFVYVWLKLWASWITIEKTDTSVPRPALQIPKEITPLLVSTFDYQMGSYIGNMMIATPAFYLSAAVNRERKKEDSFPGDLAQNIQRMTIRIRAELTRTRITVNHLKTLREGDILPITWPNVAYLKVGKRYLHKVKPAMQGDQLTLEIINKENQEL